MQIMKYKKKQSPSIDSLWHPWKGKWELQGFPYEGGGYGPNGKRTIRWLNSAMKIESRNVKLENMFLGKKRNVITL